jgi:hypothetical protein
MFTKTIVPNTFYDGELLDPNKVNDNNIYVNDVINYIASNRYVRSVVVLPFYLGVTSISQADNQATRSYLIPAVNNLVIERISMVGALASGAATINIYNATTGTTAPSGVSNPIFTPTTTSTSQIYTQPITLAAGAVYRLEITGTTFATSKLDVELILRSDKLCPSGTDLTPAPEFTLFEEVDSLDATEFTAAVTALTAAVTTLTANTTALRVQAATFSSFSNATDADTLRMDLPLATNTVASESIYTMVSSVSMAAAGAALQQITCGITTAVGGSIGVSNVHSVSGLTESTATDSTVADIAVATPAVISDNSADYRITVANSAATVCSKATIWLFTT